MSVIIQLLMSLFLIAPNFAVFAPNVQPINSDVTMIVPEAISLVSPVTADSGIAHLVITSIYDTDSTPFYSVAATDAGLTVIFAGTGKRVVITRAQGIPDNTVTKVKLISGVSVAHAAILSVAVKAVTREGASGQPGMSLHSLHEPDAMVYFTVKNGGLWRLKLPECVLTPVVYLPAGSPLNWISAFDIVKTNDVVGTSLYFGVVKRGLFKLVNGLPVKVKRVPDFTLRGIALWGEGTVYFSADDGNIYRLLQGKKKQKLLLVSKAAHALDIDIEVEAGGETSHLVSRSVFNTCTYTLKGKKLKCVRNGAAAASSPKVNHITATAAVDGHLLVGTYEAGLHLVVDGVWHRVAPEITFVNALLVTDAGVYVGTRAGLFLLAPPTWKSSSPSGSSTPELKTLKHFGAGAGLVGDRINGLTRAGDIVVIALSEGVCMLDQSIWEADCLTRSELPGAPIAHLALIHEEQLYIAGNTGLLVSDGEGFEVIDMASHGLLENWIMGAAFVDDQLYLGFYSKGVQLLDCGPSVKGSACALVKTVKEDIWINPDGIRQIDDRLYLLTLNDGVHVLDLNAPSASPLPLNATIPATDVTDAVVVGSTLFISTRSGMAALPMTGFSGLLKNVIGW